MANVLGPRNARLWYYALVCGAYAAVVGMIFAGILSAWSLAVFLTIPLAVRTFRCAHTSDPERAEVIATMDVQTAQLHLAFGLLLTASILVGAMTQ
jgi:1,4-dihydroxy-2-naphthoate octaprenyltransferase